MSTASRRPRRGSLAWWVFLAILLVPLLEVFVIVSVGRVIGAWPTIALLVFESALGAWLVRREGARAWGALRTALATGRMPSVELADAALVLVGGVLLLTPGFVSDVFGFAAILPFTRPLARGVLARVIARRLVTAGPTIVGSTAGGAGPMGPMGPRVVTWTTTGTAGTTGTTGSPFGGSFGGSAGTAPGAGFGGATRGARRPAPGSVDDDGVIEGEIL